MAEPAYECFSAVSPIREISPIGATERSPLAAANCAPLAPFVGELAVSVPRQVEQRVVVRELLRGIALEEISETGGEMPGTTSIAVLSPTEPLAQDEPELAGRFLQLRHEYVTAMHWIEDSGSDEDAYDRDPATRYFVKTQTGGESPLVCGLRLTRVPTVEDSLTWSMLAHRPELQASIEAEQTEALERLQTAGRDGRLWDLTRLVPQMDGSASVKQIVTGIHELFGAALGETTQDEQTPLWFFLTTASFRNVLVRSGIQAETLYAGNVNEQDVEESFLCLIDPLAAYWQLALAKEPRQQAAYTAVSRGLVR